MDLGQCELSQCQHVVSEEPRWGKAGVRGGGQLCLADNCRANLPGPRWTTGFRRE